MEERRKMPVRFERNINKTLSARGIINGKFCCFDMPSITEAPEIHIHQWSEHKEIINTIFNRNSNYKFVRCRIYDLVEPYNMTTYSISRADNNLFNSI